MVVNSKQLTQTLEVELEKKEVTVKIEDEHQEVIHTE